MKIYRIFTTNAAGERRLSHVFKHWKPFENKKQYLEARRIPYTVEIEIVDTKRKLF